VVVAAEHAVASRILASKSLPNPRRITEHEIGNRARDAISLRSASFRSCEIPIMRRATHTLEDAHDEKKHCLVDP
jgi:hypothetical protein